MKEIEKTIHYCWFGGNKKNKLIKKCINSWKRYMPEYEIKEWNEENFDVNCNKYVKQAYECKKYAFVTDYARLKIIYENGGIYFDTDVEVLKNFSKLLQEKGYLGFENAKNVNTGIGFAAHKHNNILKKLMETYDDIQFVDENGEMDMTPCTIRNMEVLEILGLRYSDEIQEFGDFFVYPPKYFCGFDLDNSCYQIQEETMTVHHFNASWETGYTRFVSIIKRKVMTMLGKENAEKIRKLKKNIEKKVKGN